MSRINRGKAHLDQLRAQAIAMVEERAKRPPAQQLVGLDERLGEGQGAVEARRRLEIYIEKAATERKVKERREDGKQTKQKSTPADFGWQSKRTR